MFLSFFLLFFENFGGGKSRFGGCPAAENQRQQLKVQLPVLDEGSKDNLFEKITESDVEDAFDDLNLVDAFDEETNIHVDI